MTCDVLSLEFLFFVFSGFDSLNAFVVAKSGIASCGNPSWVFIPATFSGREKQKADA